MIEFHGTTHYLEAESRAWESAGIELPAPLAQVFSEAHTTGDRADLLERPATVDPKALHRAGMPAREAVLAAQAHAVDLAAYELEYDGLASQAIHAAERVNRIVSTTRDELIALANEALVALMDEAGELTKKGVPTEERVLASGKEADLRALRTLRSLESRWASIRTAHELSLRTHSRTAPSLPCGLGDVNPAFRYFARPDLVRDDVLAGRTRTRNGAVVAVPVPSLVDLTTVPEAAGVRLATWADIQRVYGTLVRTDASRHVQIPFLGVGRHDALPANLTDGLVVS